jgi:drug/metabolite transporter (DMT)-like permease
MNPKPVVLALLSAMLFGVSVPLAKLLLGAIRPVALAGLLYLGAFIGLTAFKWARGSTEARKETPSRDSAAPDPERRAPREAGLDKKDLPWLAGAVMAGGIAAPICLMAGLDRISGTSASLLLNFEAPATALIAVFLFRENAGRRVWLGLALMTFAGVLLSWAPGGGRIDIGGPALVLLAMFGWGLDNNLTRQIADKDPVQIARIKGLGAGAVSTAAAFILGRGFRLGLPVACGLALGALCYGLSLVLFIRALKSLGAFRTGALFSSGPFIGALASLLVLRDAWRWTTGAAGLLMVAAVLLLLGERHIHAHRHERMIHTHSHDHHDLHHSHTHEGPVAEPHTHEHVHEERSHVHGHWPDTHHRHGHGNPEI